MLVTGVALWAFSGLLASLMRDMSSPGSPYVWYVSDSQAYRRERGGDHQAAARPQLTEGVQSRAEVGANRRQIRIVTRQRNQRLGHPRVVVFENTESVY